MSEPGPIDVTKVSTGLAQRAIDRLLDFAESKIKQKWAEHKNKSTELFSEYMQAQAQRCSLVRTLIYDKQSVRLDDIYVPLMLNVKDIGNLSTQRFIEVMLEQRDPTKQRPYFAGIVEGSAGSGKTFFMRHLFISTVKASTSKIPVFLEARELNDCSRMNFASMIVLSFQLAGLSITAEQVIDGLNNGLFLFILDGFDEIRQADEQYYGRQLQRAIQEYKLCPIVISGRPNERMHVSNHLQLCNICTLTTRDSVELINKLNFDEKVKRSFVKLIHEELHATHREFLELPLLCVVMLITYSDAGRISKRWHEFYEDAFNALWSKHDARKQAGYEREKYTGLDKHSFSRLLAAFCASSYVSEDFSMREDQLAEHLKKAIRLASISVNQSDFVRDMTLSTSLLVMDGNNYRFSHRSFQEYFCALYVAGRPDDSFYSAVEAVSARYRTDSVLYFTASISQERFERIWVAPKLPRALTQYRAQKDTIGSYRKFILNPDGVFLAKLRDVYSMSASNARAAELISKFNSALDGEYISRGANRKLGRIPIDELSDFCENDIQQFESLLRSITKKYQEQAAMDAALFGSNDKKIATGSGKKSQR